MLTKYEKELGMDKSITRRDFVIGSSLILGSAAIGSGREVLGKPNSKGDLSVKIFVAMIMLIPFRLLLKTFKPI